jgi:hypothetical protein
MGLKLAGLNPEHPLHLGIHEVDLGDVQKVQEPDIDIPSPGNSAGSPVLLQAKSKQRPTAGCADADTLLPKTKLRHSK